MKERREHRSLAPGRAVGVGVGVGVGLLQGDDLWRAGKDPDWALL
jgi:hypothetical protein